MNLRATTLKSFDCEKSPESYYVDWDDEELEDIVRKEVTACESCDAPVKNGNLKIGPACCYEEDGEMLIHTHAVCGECDQ